MNADEIAARMRSGGLALAFDTNALYIDGRLIRCCSGITRFNERLVVQDRSPVRLIVCAVAHAEKVFDLKQKFRGTFDHDVILQGLQSKGLAVQPFDARHALETAVRLGERYARAADWHEAKKTRCLQCLGLSKASAPGTGKECGATVDWLIGGHARAEGCVLVTDDTGPEFTGLIDRVRLKTLEDAIQRLLDEPA